MVQNSPHDSATNSPAAAGLKTGNDQQHKKIEESTQSANKLPSKIEALENQVQQLQQQLIAVQERERRAIADYQNMMRRNQEEKMRFIQLANVELMGALLQPLDHLSLAATQLKDKGLDMVVAQFWTALKDLGLEEIAVLDKPFDLGTMEVVEKTGKAAKVVQVTSRGYKLHGVVIRHAKVVLG